MDPSAAQELLGGASSPVVGASSNNAAAAAAMVTNGANGAGAGSALSSSSIASSSSGADPVQREINSRKNSISISQAHTDTEPPQLPQRRCFVTVGATAGFRDLIAEVSTPAFLATLARLGFGRLDVQGGPDADFFRDRINNLSEAERQGLTIRWFGLAASLEEYFLACRGERDVRLAGCVISHAGKFDPISSQTLASYRLMFPPRQRNCYRGAGRRCATDCRRECDTDGQSPT